MKSYEHRMKSSEKQPCTLAHNGGPQTERQLPFIFRTPSCACCSGGLEIVTIFKAPIFKHEIGIIKPENGISLLTKPTSGDVYGMVRHGTATLCHVLKVQLSETWS